MKALQRGFQHGILSGDRLVDDAGRYPNAAVSARLGYLLKRLGRPEAQALRPAAHRLKHPVFLSLKAPREGARVDPVWRVAVNVSERAFEPIAVA